MADMPELDPEKDDADSLEAKLREYAQAVRSEFEDATATLPDDTDAETFSIDFAKDQLPNNLAQIQWLAQNSVSDGVRANCAKFLVQLARESAKEDGDPLEKIFKKISVKQIIESGSHNLGKNGNEQD